MVLVLVLLLISTQRRRPWLTFAQMLQLLLPAILALRLIQVLISNSDIEAETHHGLGAELDILLLRLSFPYPHMRTHTYHSLAPDRIPLLYPFLYSYPHSYAH